MFDEQVRFTPWWWEAAPPEVARPPSLPRSIDVAVVGSGYTGLSAALTLARAGRSVAVLEAQALGHGASTRNGGQVGSGNQKFTVRQLVDLYGEAKARALVNEGTAMLRHIAELIEREGIACEFRRVGRFRGCMHPAHYESMARGMEDLKRFAGVEFFMVPRAEQGSEIGSDRYFGGSVLPNDAALHPGLYHQGLMERARGAGALLLPFTPVTGIAREGARTRVHTAGGAIEARDVLVATNGYTTRALPWVRRRVIPVGSAIIATEELPAERIARLMPRGRVYGNSARVFHYFRPSPDGRRMLWGGRVGRLGSQASTGAFEHLRKEMVVVFPDLAGVRVTHCWSGNIAYTHDTMPHIGCQDGIHYATGYCGTGVSRSTYFGHKAALKVLGDPGGRTAFDDLEFRTHRFHWATPLAVPVVETWYRIRDAMGP
ncbi:MAG: FAD-binding oxidoreductase [Gammaproteobacteria bacterium]|nr:FAD-binding oxidoreductase [Gammaproteobacteria bacterium]MCG3146394.1 Gamma-glutamylputrescine oxidoreductase [Gammaproteobacteria bacterium]